MNSTAINCPVVQRRRIGEAPPPGIDAMTKTREATATATIGGDDSRRHGGMTVVQNRRGGGPPVGAANSMNIAKVVVVTSPVKCAVQFGFPVNGFHPQWPGSAAAQGPVSFPTSSRFPIVSSGGSGGGSMELLPPSFVEKRLHAKIGELIGRVRREEAQKFNKRKGELDACDLDYIDDDSFSHRHRAPAAKRQRRTYVQREHREDVVVPAARAADNSLAAEDSSSSTSSDFSDVYSDVFINSNVAQVIATPGGRVVAWNDKFLDETGYLPNQVSASLTVFNLIQAEMLPKLFDLFSLALRGGSPSPLILQSPLRAACFGGGFQAATPTKKAPSLVSDTEDHPPLADGDGESRGDDDTGSDRSSDYDESEDDSDVDESTTTTRSSMTLPCVHFPAAPPNRRAPLLVTVTLMNDVDPEKRCFHCVFAPDPDASTRTHTTTTECSSSDGEQQQQQQHAVQNIINVDTTEIMGEIRRISHKSFANLL